MDLPRLWLLHYLKLDVLYNARDKPHRLRPRPAFAGHTQKWARPPASPPGASPFLRPRSDTPLPRPRWSAFAPLLTFFVLHRGYRAFHTCDVYQTRTQIIHKIYKTQAPEKSVGSGPSHISARNTRPCETQDLAHAQGRGSRLQADSDISRHVTRPCVPQPSLHAPPPEPSRTPLSHLTFSLCYYIHDLGTSMGSAAAAQHESVDSSVVLACVCSPCRAEAVWTAD
jgi:hypothetical protein